MTRIAPGLTLATAEMPQMRSVCVGVWFVVGSRYEPAPVNGVAHFIEHMLFKGTAKRSSREISQAVESLGGSLEAFTSEESTCIYSKARADRFEDLLGVMMDMVLGSRFKAEEVEKERGIIKEELAMYLDQPHHHVEDLLCETMWPKHPLGRPLTGTEETIDNLTRRVLVAFQKRNYLASNTLVVAAGAIGHDKLVQAMSRFARHFRLGEAPNYVPAVNDQDQPRVRLSEKEVEQTQLSLGFRTCSYRDPLRFGVRLLNTLLGSNMSSRLFQVVREDHGLAYHIDSGLNSFDDAGNLVVSAGVDPDDLLAALKLIVRELRRITKQPPSRKELRAAQDYMIGQLELGLESTEQQMHWAAEQIMEQGIIARPDQLKRNLAQVSAHEVQQAARDFLRPERASLALVSPMKRNGELARILGKL